MCKLVNTKKEMTFCRFLRMNGDKGYHLEDGHGDENYHYFGAGFHQHECGISITKPTDNDKSIWKCFIGVELKNDHKVVGAILDARDTKDPGNF